MYIIITLTYVAVVWYILHTTCFEEDREIKKVKSVKMIEKTISL